MDIEATCAWIAASNWRPATKKSYEDNLRRFSAIPEFRENPVGVLEEMYVNINTLRARLGVLLVLHYRCPHFELGGSLEYARLLVDKLQDDRVEVYERRERRQNDVDWTDVQAAEARVAARDLLLFRCLTRLPPQRCSDFADMRLVEEDDGGGNVYVRSTQQFIFRAYKTAKRRGTKVVDVPNEIAALIPTDQAYLFQSRAGTGVGFPAMSKRIRATFARAGMRVSAIALRRSFASMQLKEGVEGMDLARVAADMDHTSRTHRWYAFR